MCNGWGLLRGMMSPHYNHRPEFDDVVAKEQAYAYAVEDRCALHWRDEQLHRVVSCGGNAYILDATNGELQKTLIDLR